MMHNNSELATREYIPDEKTTVSEGSIDFTVPVIDHFGDMGFALSLALSLIRKRPEYRVRFFSEDSDLFQKMLGGKIPERLSYFPLHDWGTLKRNSIRCNFFGYKIQESELVGHENPMKILNFDYLQFHRGTGPADPGISSLHGTEYELGGKKIVHLVPSLLTEGGGVTVPQNGNSPNREAFLRKIGLPSELSKKKWCSVFVYPNTLERIVNFAAKHLDWIFFVYWNSTIIGKNIVCLPFLPLQTYSEFLGLCDTNVVRGENSLVSAVLSGKPFLWDIYRENNGAHREKMEDFGKFVDTFVDWSETLGRFLESEDADANLEKMIGMENAGFEKMAEVVRKRDILETLLRYL